MTLIPKNATITGLFASLCEEQPDALFCRFYRHGKVEDITRGDLIKASLSFAHAYKKAGLTPGNLVVIILDHRPELLSSFIGALLGGFIPSFMPPLTEKQTPDIYWNSHAKLFERIDISLIVTFSKNASSLRKHLPGLPYTVFCVEGLKPLSAPPPAETRQKTESTAFLQHSSGTTGLKKGVEIQHDTLISQIDLYTKALSLSLSSQDKIASWLPLYHDMGLIASFLLPLATGIPVSMLDPFEWVKKPLSLLEVMEKDKCTHCWLPNFAFNHIANNFDGKSSLDLSCVKALINCSEPCKPESFEFFLHKFSSHGLRRDALQVCYAMAENVFAVTQTPYGSIPKTLSADIEAFHKSEHIEEGNGIFFLSSGTPLSGIEVEISGKDGRLLPERQVGEVIFSSPCLFKGYYKLPELTSRKIKNGFYFSGDMGFMENGELYITGRKDDLLISYGKNVYAHSIEEIVNTVDGIIPGRNIAISVPNETTGTDDIIIICETSPPSDNRLKIKIKQGVFDCLDLMVSRIKLVEKGWLIKTTSGKISRNLNKEKFIKTMKGK